MSKFEYPRLSRKEIIGVLAEAQIASVSDADLIHPNPDLVSNLYTRILIHIDCLQGDHGQVDFAALEQLENPDHHVDSVRMVNVFNKMREIIAAVDCPRKFTLRDLAKPDADRTELFLSALLNFCLHKDTRMDLLRPCVEDLTLLDEQRKELESRVSQSNADIADFNESREREMPLVQELDVKVKVLQQAKSRLYNHRESLEASNRKMGDKTKEMDEKISRAAFDLVQSHQENAILRSKIVQSPDKLQSALEEKKSIQVEAKNAERAEMQSFLERNAILEVYTKARKKIYRHFGQMQALQEQVNSAKLVEKDVKDLKDKHSHEGLLDKSLEAKLVERQGKADQFEELRKQLEKERDLNCEEATKELNNVRLQVESNRLDLGSRQRNVESKVAEAGAINAKIISEKESGAAKQQELCRKNEEIVKESKVAADFFMDRTAKHLIWWKRSEKFGNRGTKQGLSSCMSWR